VIVTYTYYPKLPKTPKIKVELQDNGWYAFINKADFSACNHPHETSEEAIAHAKERYDEYRAETLKKIGKQ